MIIVSDISLPFSEPPALAKERAKKLVGGNVLSAEIARRAVDARHKNDIRFVYSVAVSVDGDERRIVEKLANPKIRVKHREALEIAPPQKKIRPVVAGFGPAGMFAALIFARMGLMPIVLERGAPVEQRVKDVDAFMKTGALNSESNIQFGEGGAGTFSDGKLTTRVNDPYCAFVLEELVRHGAPEEILIQAKPHVGTDKLRFITKSIREEITSLGGRILFNTRLTDILLNGGCVHGVKTTRGDFQSDALVLALGHSARDTVEMLAEKGLSVSPKPFSVGVRIEHAQSDVDAALYGCYAGHPLLPKAEYQHSLRVNNRAVYTFCMCPGGAVVPAASEESMVVTNGMSLHARDSGVANAALVVSVDSSDFGNAPLAGIEFQRTLERAAFAAGGGGYRAPAQDAGSFLDGKPGLVLGRVKPSYLPGVTSMNLAELFPGAITQFLKDGLAMFNKRQPGFSAKDSILTGVETRTSSPVRLERGANMQAAGIGGLYPCGEGAGYAGGIMTSAVDGIRAALAAAGYSSEN